MKYILGVMLISIAGCAYTLKDVYSRDHEVIVVNESPRSITTKVSFNKEEVVVDINPGERKSAGYFSLGLNDDAGALEVTISSGGVIMERYNIPISLNSRKNPGDLWRKHEITFSSE